MSDDKPTHDAPQWRQVPPYQKEQDARRPNVVAGKKYSTRVPKLPFEYFLTEAGNLVRLAVGSTRNFKGAVEGGGDPTRQIVFNRNRAIREGKIPWEYESVKRHAPHIVGAMTREQWEVWREEELQRRRKIHNEQQTLAATQFTSGDTRQAAAVVKEMMRVAGLAALPAPEEAAGKNPFAKGKKAE